MNVTYENTLVSMPSYWEHIVTSDYLTKNRYVPTYKLEVLKDGDSIVDRCRRRWWKIKLDEHNQHLNPQGAIARFVYCN